MMLNPKALLQVGRLKKTGVVLGKILLGLFILCLIALGVIIFVILPYIEVMGAHDQRPFSYITGMNIEKKTPSGVTYSINNGAATFRLDVAKPDNHSKQIFTNYAAALMYCQEQGLPVTPSVQLIQGKLKAFDEVLCITLELAIEERRLKVLKDLLAALQREGNLEAVVHVATALSLAGVDPKVEGETLRRVETERHAFLQKPEARPCGFWDTDERLRRNFQSGRYLMAGLRVIDHPEACIVISKVVMGDPSLKAAFENVQAFDAKLTNPLKSASFEALYKLTTQEVKQGFTRDDCFSLFGYSTSKEESILDAIARKREIRSHEELMPLIIKAIRSGEFSLEPKPSSGWYDYQWHALETLLLPEKGRESAKLRLSKAYRMRLENAFASLLTKERETRLKTLPITALGCMSEEEMESPPIVRIAPEFSAEPTLTVYLRLGRSYRFLRHTLQASLGAETWSRLQLSGSIRSLDEELKQTMLFCYGLYERLSLEIGERPLYLIDEMHALEIEEARAVFDCWFKGWQADPALLTDSRVAVPVADRLTHYTYWGTAGVRLEPVVYKYLDKPDVSGRVEPEFVPCKTYLPTDFFFEFSRPPQTSLTRAEFRSLCDKGQDVPALYKIFGATPPAAIRGTWLTIRYWLSAQWGWGVLIVFALLFWRVRRARLWLGLGLLMLIVGGGALLVCSPYYRTLFIVRHVATINDPMGLCSENRLLPQIEGKARLKALSTLLVDPNSNIRYLAARFMNCRTLEDDDGWEQVEVKERLMQAADDSDAEIAVLAVCALCHYRDTTVVDFLIKKLSGSVYNDYLCWNIIHVLGEIKDPRAINVIRPLCEDPRRLIGFGSIITLGKFSKQDVMETLMELAESPVSEVRHLAINTIRREVRRWEGKDLSEDELNRKYDELFLERLKRDTLSFDAKQVFAFGIKDEALKLEARAFNLREATSLDQTNGVLLAVAGQFVKKQMNPKGEWESFSTIVTNSPARLEMADAISQKDATGIKQALIKMVTPAASDSDPMIRSLAERLMNELQKKTKPRKQR